MKTFSIFLIVLVCYLALVQGKSDCETHRERELRPGNKFPKAALLIPKCDSEGNYEPLQCHGEPSEKKRACQCWAKNGDILTSPSFKRRYCSCILAKTAAEKARSGDVPTCAEDGRFERKQCNGGSCHCVNQDTGKRESGSC